MPLKIGIKQRVLGKKDNARASKTANFLSSTIKFALLFSVFVLLFYRAIRQIE